ncbi:XrtA/PEP-CTERM system TPR-repeat protein PrsT [Thalassotalea sediminis]|uniref:XrtA/PEP-CTERM system TPR-repeat protein PrsT n=1 Tax=Thalassotalea sediminis TaxID=1759089 RepID=UPI0025736363|nr:XrtA/PEP-CTERM system TPR-repeat protein PrsT [Thalassotalea sediminis]
MISKKTALSLAVMLALTACGDKLTVEDYLAQAKQHQTENKLKESEIALKNAIQLAPKNAEARVSLGKLYLSLGNSASAIKELERGQSLKYKGRDLVPLLARAYLIADDNAGVIGLSEAADKLPEDQRVIYLSYKTLALIETGETKEARITAKAASKLLPANPHAVLANAYIAMVDDESERASALVDKSLQLDPENPEGHMFQGQIFIAQGNFDDAAKSFEKYLALQPESNLTLLLLADTLVKTDRYLEAEKYADTILAAMSEQPVANYVKAVVRFAEKDYEQALKYAEVGLTTQYMKPHLRLVAGASAFYLAKYEQANFHLGTIVDQLTPEHSARKMYAVSQFHVGKIENITDSLQSYVPVSEEDQEFMSSLSFSLYSMGATEQAKMVADRVSQSSLDSAKSSGRKGILKLMMDDISGVDDLEAALEKNPDLVGAELALAYVALEQKEYDKAIEIAQNWQAKYPDKADGYNMLAAVYVRQGDLEKAKSVLMQSLENAPNNAFALTELTSVYVKQGNKKDAKETAQKAVTQHPNNLKALHNNYALFRNEAALAAIKKSFDTVEYKNNIAPLYMQALLDGDNVQAMLNVVDELTLDFKTPKRVWQLQVFAYHKLQKGARIKETLDKWTKANPYHVEPIFLLADYYVKSKKPALALDTINDALNGIHANNTNLKLVKMQLLLDNRNTSEAKRLFKELESASIDENLAAGINGRILLLEGKFEEAIDGLEQYYNAYPTSQNAVLLALAHSRSNDSASAIAGLEKHLEKNENDYAARNLLANYYVQQDKSKALKQYESLVKSQPLNVVALNNLAWLSLENNDIEKAASYAKKAYDLAPKVPNIADTYAKTLFAQGDKRGALDKSKEAYDLTNGKDVDISLNYAEILIAGKEKALAKEILQNQEVTSDEQRERIKKLLDQLYKL